MSQSSDGASFAARRAPATSEQREALLSDLDEIAGDIAALAQPNIELDLESLSRPWTGEQVGSGRRRVAHDVSRLVAATHYAEPAVSDRLERATEGLASARDALQQLTLDAGDNAENRQLSMLAVTSVAAARVQLEAAALMGDDIPVAGVVPSAAPVALAFGAVGHAASAVLGKLKAALSSIWNLLSHILKPTEWKVAGEIGGGIPGLGMVSATIEISFG